MRGKDEEILKCQGWVIECESPFEIRHEDGSFATGQAASIVVEYLRENFKEIQDMNSWVGRIDDFFAKPGDCKNEK